MKSFQFPFGVDYKPHMPRPKGNNAGSWMQAAAMDAPFANSYQGYRGDSRRRCSTLARRNMTDVKALQVCHSAVQLFPNSE
jgi:hypothetical protein